MSATNYVKSLDLLRREEGESFLHKDSLRSFEEQY
jgi:hypothetical protein